MLLAFNKPYGVLSQFTDDGSQNRTLAEFGFPPRVYALGRLDADSEGLLLLSDESGLNSALLDPANAHARRYLVQVEGIPSVKSMEDLKRGPTIGGYKTRPCRAVVLDPQPEIEDRIPPIRVRKSVPDCWIEIELHEGKNRQVRRMTAAVGHPTLRLIRHRIGGYVMQGLAPGQWKELGATEREQIFENFSSSSKKAPQRPR